MDAPVIQHKAVNTHTQLTHLNTRFHFYCPSQKILHKPSKFPMKAQQRSLKENLFPIKTILWWEIPSSSLTWQHFHGESHWCESKQVVLQFTKRSHRLTQCGAEHMKKTHRTREITQNNQLWLLFNIYKASSEKVWMLYKIKNIAMS